MTQLPSKPKASKGPVKFKTDTPSTSLTPNESDPTLLAHQIKETTGLKSSDAALHLMSQVLYSRSDHTSIDAANAEMGLMHGLAPKDTLEGLLTAQMVVTHELAMTFVKRAMLAEQTVDNVTRNVNRMTKLMRVFNSQVETLIRYRTQGQQVIQVQHVNVNAGGQAMVGNIQASKVNRD